MIFCADKQWFIFGSFSLVFIKPFVANIPILYPLKTPENLVFSGGMKWRERVNKFKS